MDKPFKTFLEQVEILNTRMKTDKETIYYLMRNNYYSIINFYKDPFLIFRRREIYRNGTHFNDLKSLYEFDRNLRTLFFTSLNKTEKSLLSSPKVRKCITTQKGILSFFVRL